MYPVGLPSRTNGYVLILTLIAALLSFSCGGAIQATTPTGNSSSTGAGTGGSAPTASLSQTSISFSNQTLSTTSVPQTITLTNTGTASLSIDTIAASGDFAQVNNCGPSLAVGAACSFTVSFTPIAAGTRTGTLSIADNAAGSPHQVALSGTGVTAAVPLASLSETSVTFSNVAVNTSSVAQTVTLINTGTATLNISSIGVSGDFAQANNCGTSLAAGADCGLTITFTPTATGTRNGTLTIIDNAAGSPQQVALTGSGVTASGPVASLSLTSLSFGNQVVNTSSPVQTITLSNPGKASLTITLVGISGDFTQTNTCGTSLTAGTSCVLTVTFTPATTGALGGTLSITDNASGSPQQVALTGTGVSPGQLTANPSSIAFGPVIVGQGSTQPVKLTNTGGASLTVSASTSGPGFSVSGLTLLTLAAGASSTFNVSFTPSNPGSATGSVSLSNTGATSPVVVSLSGTGNPAPSHQVSLTWTASSSQVAGYNIYRGSISGGPYSKLNSALDASTTYTDQTVQAGTTYFYVATSVDGSGDESVYSNQATAVVPTP